MEVRRKQCSINPIPPQGDSGHPLTLPYGESRLQSNPVPREGQRAAGTRLEKGGGGGSQQSQRAGGDGPWRRAAQRPSGGGVPRAAPTGGSQ